MTTRASDTVTLDGLLKALRLPVMRREYPECARQARQQGLSYEEFLLDLVIRESEQRRANQLQRRLKEAAFPYMKPIENTELAKWPGLNAMTIRAFCECDYVRRAENVVLLGKHGTGKTHAAIAFGIEACRKGYRVWFRTAAELVNMLIEARDDRDLNRLLKKLERVDLLIIDELGYLPLAHEGAQLLFQVVSKRYERKSIMITTNLPFPEWTACFGDVNLTAALLDRVTHHCHIHEFVWESIRFMESLKRKGEKLHKIKTNSTSCSETASIKTDQTAETQSGD